MFFTVNRPAWADDFSSETSQAKICVSNGSLAQAEEHFKKASLAAKKKSPQYGDYATSLLNLGSLYCQEKKGAEAENCYKEALDIYKKAYGENTLETARAYNGLGDAYRLQEIYEKAAPWYEKAAKIREASAPEHTDLADTSASLAECYGHLGRKTDAITLVKRAVSIRQKALGNRDPLVAKTYFLLANLYEDTGKTQMAIPVYEKVVSVCETTYGAESPKVATTLEHLASMYQKEKRLADAEKTYKKALAIREKKPSDTAKIKACIKAYAQVLKQDNKSDEASKLESKLASSAAPAKDKGGKASK